MRPLALRRGLRHTARMAESPLSALTSDQWLVLLVASLWVLVACAFIYFALTRSSRPLRVLSRRLEELASRQMEAGQAVSTALGLLRDEQARAAAALREEAAASAKAAREDAAARIDGLGVNLHRLLDVVAQTQRERLEQFAASMADARAASDLAARALREELTGGFDRFGASVTSRLGEQTTDQTTRLEGFATRLSEHRTATGEDARALREEVNTAVAALSASLVEGLGAQARSQTEALAAAQAQIKDMMDANERAALGLRQTVEGRLETLRQDNEAKLEQMRATVDEKLQSTLEQRLGASFTQVSEQLERVFKSVGEMQTIATGVGDLKRVLSNVKTRGTWGEVSLGMLLEQILTTEQYASNVEIEPGSNKRVEFAIRLPGDGDRPVWLPIDAKMPTEDYERVVEAAERADGPAVELAQKGLERAIKLAAKDIGEKYVRPPHSTDFGIMFLPTEGLFAEVVRQPGLVDTLQREHRVMVTGPTTLMSTLTALRMGFRTLAIQERSSEVWRVLGAVKQEFGRFGDMLDKVERKLGEAQKTVHDAGVRRRAMDRKLRDVEVLPGSGPQAALPHVSSADLMEDLLDDLDGPG